MTVWRNCIQTAVIGLMLVTRFTESVKHNQRLKSKILDLQPSLINFYVSLQRFTYQATNCDILGQLTVPVLGQLFWIFGWAFICDHTFILFRVMYIAGVEGLL